MKVLMLNYEYPPVGGGTGNANRYILEEIENIEGVEVDLVTSSENKEKVEELESTTIYRLDVGKKDIHHWRQMEVLRYMFKGFLKARKLSRKNDYDVVHAWTGFPCGLMAEGLDTPYIVGLRGSDVPGYNERFSLQYLFLKPLIRKVWKDAESVVPNSDDLRNLAQKTLEMPMEVVQNGVDTDKFCPGSSDSELLEVLTVGRLTPRKRVGDVIEAVSELGDVRLTIVGEGEQEQQLKRKVEELESEQKIHFDGYVPHDELPEIYSKSDVFVLPSLNEGMSNTLLEAISSGLPIITTDTGGASELVQGNGYIVPMKSPEAIMDRLRGYRDDEQKRKRHSEKSRKLAEKRSWTQIAEEYVELYRTVSKSR